MYFKLFLINSIIKFNAFYILPQTIGIMYYRLNNEIIVYSHINFC